ncbi:unnamed protein product, partial [Mycena citricolor]
PARDAQSYSCCSVPCYKKHKETECSPDRTREVATRPQSLEPSPPPLAEPFEAPPPEEDAPPLRPLTSLNWPYVPEESAYPDPLKRDDPK